MCGDRCECCSARPSGEPCDASQPSTLRCVCGGAEDLQAARHGCTAWAEPDRAHIRSPGSSRRHRHADTKGTASAQAGKKFGYSLGLEHPVPAWTAPSACRQQALSPGMSSDRMGPCWSQLMLTIRAIPDVKVPGTHVVCRPVPGSCVTHELAVFGRALGRADRCQTMGDTRTFSRMLIVVRPGLTPVRFQTR